VAPLRLWYEDLLARPEETVREVAAYLGVDLVTGTEVPVPPILKQSGAGAEDWGSRYERAKAAARK
jgi:LPS sulfotransferase NodH